MVPIDGLLTDADAEAAGADKGSAGVADNAGRYAENSDLRIIVLTISI
jgi:hypothetical protein